MRLTNLYADIKPAQTRHPSKYGAFLSMPNPILQQDSLTAPSPLHETRYAQPCLFAVQWGLARALAARGVVSGAVMGQGCGEHVAACLAGVFHTGRRCFSDCYPVTFAPRVTADRGYGGRESEQGAGGIGDPANGGRESEGLTLCFCLRRCYGETTTAKACKVKTVLCADAWRDLTADAPMLHTTVTDPPTCPPAVRGQE